MTTGIVLIAVGDWSYGIWAAQMAVSIRANCDLPIQLIFERKALKKMRGAPEQFFDVLTEINSEDAYFDGRLEAGRLKLHLDKYIAFDRSLFFDVDGVCIADPSKLLKSCKRAFHTQVEKVHDENSSFLGWTDRATTYDVYNLTNELFYETNTSFMYLKKGRKLTSIFNAAREASTVDIERRKWGFTQAMPDELCLGVACAKLNHDPSIDSKPIYFRIRKDKGAWVTLDELKSKHTVIGCWGNNAFNHLSVKSYYDNLVDNYFREVKGWRIQTKFHQLISRKYLINA